MNIKIAFHRFMMRNAFMIWSRYLIWRNRDLFRNVSTYHIFDDIDLMNAILSEDDRRRSDAPLTLFLQPENSKHASEKAHWNGGFYCPKQAGSIEANCSPLKSFDHEQHI